MRARGKPGDGPRRLAEAGGTRLSLCGAGPDIHSRDRSWCYGGRGHAEGVPDLSPGTLEKANSPTAAPDLTLAVRAIMDFPMPGRPIETPKRRIHA